MAGTVASTSAASPHSTEQPVAARQGGRGPRPVHYADALGRTRADSAGPVRRSPRSHAASRTTSGFGTARSGWEGPTTSPGRLETRHEYGWASRTGSPVQRGKTAGRPHHGRVFDDQLSSNLINRRPRTGPAGLLCTRRAVPRAGTVLHGMLNTTHLRGRPPPHPGYRPRSSCWSAASASTERDRTKSTRRIFARGPARLAGRRHLAYAVYGSWDPVRATCWAGYPPLNRR